MMKTQLGTAVTSMFAWVNESLLTAPELEQIPSPEGAKGPEGDTGPIAKPGSPPDFTPPTTLQASLPPPPAEVRR